MINYLHRSDINNFELIFVQETISEMLLDLQSNPRHKLLKTFPYFFSRKKLLKLGVINDIT